MWRIWRKINELAKISGSYNPDGNFSHGLCLSGAVPAAQPQTGDYLTVSGVVEDAQGKGVKEVEIEVLVNGKHVLPSITSPWKPAAKAASWDDSGCPRELCPSPRSKSER